LSLCLLFILCYDLHWLELLLFPLIIGHWYSLDHWSISLYYLFGSLIVHSTICIGWGHCPVSCFCLKDYKYYLFIVLAIVLSLHSIICIHLKHCLVFYYYFTIQWYSLVIIISIIPFLQYFCLNYSFYYHSIEYVYLNLHFHFISFHYLIQSIINTFHFHFLWFTIIPIHF